MQKINKILLATVIFLSATLILHFVMHNSVQDKRKAIKTEIFNEKYKDKITSISINKTSEEAEGIKLSKQDNIWTLTRNQDTKKIIADSKQCENFINEITKLRNMYKISDQISKKDDFRFFSDTSVHVRINFNDTFVDYYFGNHDFSNTERYFMTGKSTALYQTDSLLDNYLTTSRQVWGEPYLISREIFGKLEADKIIAEGCSDNAALLELRHGGAAQEIFPETKDPSQNKKPAEKTLVIETGRKQRITLKFYKAASSEYSVKSEYYDETSKKLDVFWTKISSWTYNRIKEITL